MTTTTGTAVKILRLRDKSEVTDNIICEWQDYLVDCEGADALMVGTSLVAPIAGCRFLVCFENRVGFSVLQPFRNGAPFVRARRVEVTSPKLGSYANYRAFTEGLVNELYEFGASKVFEISGETSLSIRNRAGERSLLFLLHYLLYLGPSILRAVATVAERPHLSLVDLREERRLSQITRAGSDLVRELVRGRGGWTRAGDVAIAKRMNGLLPARIECTRGEDATDNPENRFVLGFIHTLMGIVQRLEFSKLWTRVPKQRQALLLDLQHALARASGHPTFSGVGRMSSVPAQSRVLTRREGYRQLLAAWSRLNDPSSPLFDAIEHAIEIRDVATLYEQWCFFALAEELGKLLGGPTYVASSADAVALQWNAAAQYTGGWRLDYNATRTGYSLPFRPDLVLRNGNELVAVFDAKFRASKPSASDDDSDPKRADIDKMHAYRDALGVPCAIVLYPGTETWSFAHGATQPAILTIERVMNGWNGVGAIPLRPGSFCGTR